MSFCILKSFNQYPTQLIFFFIMKIFIIITSFCPCCCNFCYIGCICSQEAQNPCPGPSTMGKGGGCHFSPPFTPLNYTCAQPICEPMSRETFTSISTLKIKRIFFPKCFIKCIPSQRGFKSFYFRRLSLFFFKKNLLGFWQIA